MIVQACIFGGVAYAGLKTLLRYRPRKKTAWLATRDRQVPSDSSPATDADSMEPGEATLSRYLTLSSVSLGLAVSGTLFYPPLRLVSVPFNVYGALPIFERAWATLFVESGRKMALIESIFLVGTLAARYDITASLLTCLHYYFALLAQRLGHFDELVRRGLEHDYRQFLAQIYGARPRSVWVMTNGVSMEIPFEKLHVGDIVVVRSGEIVPVEGTVVEGRAEVSLLMVTGAARPVVKTVEDRLLPSTMVMSGKLCIRVDRL